MARTQRVSRSRSATGSSEYAEAAPAPVLLPFVRRYTGFVERADTGLRRLEAPSSRAVLVINLGVPFAVSGPDGSAAVHVGGFLARLSPQPATTAFSGKSAGVQVDFTPIGLHLFCGIALHELPELSVGLADVLGEEGRRLEEALAAAPDWASRFDLLDAAIARRFARARGATPSVEWAWRALARSGGTAEIGALCDRLGCSPRHLIRGFREQVGVPPKTAARILRFERAAQLLRARRPVELARVAAACGYHDQAHMTREFRALAGTTPAAYRGSLLGGFEGVAAGAEVNFVQDPAAAGA